MSNFITNDDDKELKKRLVELVQHSAEMKFLVGFFYFSGVRELYKGIKDNPSAVIKVLVGLNIDQSNFRLLEYAEDKGELTGEERIEDFLGDIRRSLAEEDFDTKEFYEQVNFFLKLIIEDRLIIRKTFKPNHAKLYIFTLQPDQIGRKKLFITGSSNLTRFGLTTQAEFNVEIGDYGIEDAEKYFDDWWEDAIKITENDVIKKKVVEVIQKETLVRDVTPFEAYVLTMKTYLESFGSSELKMETPELMEKLGYIPFAYQIDAVKQGLNIIKHNNGVIIADVVGLGKTIIACCIARELNKRGLVICPPGLMGDKNKTTGWRMYLEQFQLYNWEVRSLGDLEETVKFVNKTKNLEVVIVDEVHRFRNQDTRDYELLQNICRDKNVILLTATPFNNKPADILSLLKLFITPKKSTITLENDLVAMFRSFKGTFDHLSYIRRYYNSINLDKRNKAKAYYESLFGDSEVDLCKVKTRSKFLADQIRHVIEPVTIRRNRLDLKNNPYYREEVKNLSVIADPIEKFYELSKDQSDFYDRIIKVYFGEPELGGKFKGAIYHPFEYEVEVEKKPLGEKESFEFFQQRNLFDFMRRLMVKRFESSFGSFEQSIIRFKKIAEDALVFINKTGKYILDRGLLEKIYSMEEESIEYYLKEYAQKLRDGNYPKNNRIYEVNRFDRQKEFIADIHSDIQMFSDILDELKAMDLVNNDPKAQCLLEYIDEQFSQTPKKEEPKRKIVIFSEYLDTVKHLSKVLRVHYGNRVLVEDGGLSAQKIREINQNFDAMHPQPLDYFDILLSTDRISEGFNLNRAGTVINYDIPWNPVRVIQRVGRINRISKKVFEELFIVNFFPTEKGSDLVQTREIAQNKMFLIHEVLGEDSKIFDVDETPTAAGLYERINQNPDEIESESFYTSVLKKYLSIEKENPRLVQSLKDFPARVKVSKQGEQNELLVFFKKGRLYVQGMNYVDTADNTPFNASFESVYDRVKCTDLEPKISLSENFWGAYKDIKNFREEFAVYASVKSLEATATNNLKTIQKHAWQEIRPLLPFIKGLLDDILNYGTLSDYTLRRISNLQPLIENKRKEVFEELSSLKQELGEGYMQSANQKKTQAKKEIIIAIENQTL